LFLYKYKKDVFNTTDKIDLIFEIPYERLGEVEKLLNSFNLNGEQIIKKYTKSFRRKK